ncbi:MAG TPA: hypothetical protein VLX09_02410 [Stellaceae bacterium]|nr:hypothetical protein [Stellaceae bacterium]
MAVKALRRDQIAFGRAVLLATDSVGMAAEGALWLYDRKDDTWRYFLVTSLLGRIGGREIYLRLNEALTKKLSEHETIDFMFYIASPDDQLIEKLRSRFQTARYASDPKRSNRPQVCIYRLAPRMDDGAVKTTQRRFRRESRELATA